MWGPTCLAKETLQGSVEKIIVLHTLTQSLAGNKKSSEGWDEPNEKSDGNPWRPVAKR